MSPQLRTQADPAQTLAKALNNAGQELGLTQSALAGIIGRERSALYRALRGGGLDPQSKPGELALLLIRAYRGLSALVGGDPVAMRHWMHTPNHHTGGIPAEQMKQVQGLVRVVEYLDALRGKV